MGDFWKMSTSGKTGPDGLDVSVPTAEEEAEPVESIEVKNTMTAVQTAQYIPKTIAEAIDNRASESAAETGKFARWILVGSIALIALSHIAQLFAGWTSAPVFSEGANTTLDVVKYIATTIMGYLFGKHALKL